MRDVNEQLQSLRSTSYENPESLKDVNLERRSLEEFLFQRNFPDYDNRNPEWSETKFLTYKGIALTYAQGSPPLAESFSPFIRNAIDLLVNSDPTEKIFNQYWSGRIGGDLATYATEKEDAISKAKEEVYRLYSEDELREFEEMRSMYKNSIHKVFGIAGFEEGMIYPISNGLDFHMLKPTLYISEQADKERKREEEELGHLLDQMRDV